jgi:hypothetical protein
LGRYKIHQVQLPEDHSSSRDLAPFPDHHDRDLGLDHPVQTHTGTFERFEVLNYLVVLIQHNPLILSQFLGLCLGDLFDHHLA